MQRVEELEAASEGPRLQAALRESRAELQAVREESERRLQARNAQLWALQKEVEDLLTKASAAGVA